MTFVRLNVSLLVLLLIGGGAVAQPSERTAQVVPAALVQPVADGAMTGKAAWYGRKFNGRETASGKRFNASALTAAHASLPFGTRVRVTNTENKKSVVLTINDRLNPSAGRIIDVSRAGAERLGFVKAGTAQVRIEQLGARRSSAAPSSAVRRNDASPSNVPRSNAGSGNAGSGNAGSGNAGRGNAGRGTINRYR